MKLLLIEDNAPLAHWLSEALRRAHFTVDHATDGESADTLLLTQHYDVVLLDLQLPTLSGQGVLQRLRGRRNPVPVLILTASGGIDDKVACLGAGADDYLVKPFEIRELIARIPRGYDYAAEPEMLFIPRRAAAASAPAKRRARA